MKKIMDYTRVVLFVPVFISASVLLTRGGGLLEVQKYVEFIAKRSNRTRR